MEEKKLTDEEIVKALRFAIAQGEPDGIGFWSDNMKWCEFSMRDVLDLINRQKAEIERLKGENFVLYRDRFTKKELDDISACRVKKATAELQNQVDELTDKLGKVLLGVKADELLVAKGVERAVKDTAKEICDLILEHWEKKQFVECDWLRVAIAEKYGVGVE